jgi:hypothetical protein
MGSQQHVAGVDLDMMALVRGETQGICTLKGKSEPVELVHLELRTVVMTLASSCGVAVNRQTAGS